MAISDQKSTYSYLVSHFGEDVIQSRHKWLNDILLSWIEQRAYSEKIAVMSEQVDHIIIDYYVDIDRLKEFSEIETTNTIKIYSYLAYWILRRKPLQVITTEPAEDLVFVNENMVVDFLLSFIYDNPTGIPIISSQCEQIGLFEDTLRYFLKYRTITPQVIEIMLLAFQAGRGYQFSVDYQK